MCGEGCAEMRAYTLRICAVLSLLLIVAICGQGVLAIEYQDGWYVYDADDLPWDLLLFVESVSYYGVNGCVNGLCRDVARFTLTPFGLITVANLATPLSSGWLATRIAGYVTTGTYWPRAVTPNRHPRSSISVAKEIVAHCLGGRTSMNIQYHFEGLSPEHKLYFGP